MIAEVIPEIKTWTDSEIFSYSIPPELVDKIKIGSLVEMPFGKKSIRGVVDKINPAGKKTAYKVRNLISASEDFSLPLDYLDVVHWIAQFYLCSLGDALTLFLPPQMKRPKSVLSSQFSVHSSQADIKLNTEQQKIFDKLLPSLSKGSKKPALIHGVTGSGKTEIYLKLAEETLKLGKKVIVLVPEIMLTPQTVERFEAVFGAKISLIHSHLSKSERFHAYFDFYNNTRPVMVGPRSALLVPAEQIGLIVVDEEQEDSYKQDQSPRYNAGDLAAKIAEKSGALLVYGSATPKIETYHRAKLSEIDLFELKERYNENEMPPSVVIDLREEIRAENFSPISTKLREEIQKVLEEKNQVLLFINRRGSATFVACRDCGTVILCDNCAVPMVYHLNDNENCLSCHHCDSTCASPNRCPECNSTRIKYFGSGIDKIHSEIKNMFPLARITKVDSKTITSRADYENFFQKFKNHEFDIVIGTQMIAKGLDIPNVDLVGIISADTGLHLPLYRASEKSFELLTQVSGRSGRAKRVGQTILQTYWPEAPAIVAAKNHDYDLFYSLEIKERQQHHYPPFTKLVRIIAQNTNCDKARAEIKEIATKLRSDKFEFIGPGACFYSKLNSKYRFHIIIKIDKYPDSRITKLAKENRHLIWDAEPVNLL